MKFAAVLALGLALTGSMATSLAGDSEHDRHSSKGRDNKTTTLFRLMGKNTLWTPVKSVPVNGAATDSLYDFTLDRSAGNGRGWLFKFNEAGELLGKIELTDGTKYHPGGIVHNTHSDTLHGVSWGSRRLYTWELSKHGTKVRSTDWVPNPQFYIDYQDCHYQGVEYMLCGGVQTYTTGTRGNLALGGLARAAGQ